jgi:hypothetical protein
MNQIKKFFSDPKDHESINKGLKLCNSICLNFKYKVDERLKVLVEFIKMNQDGGYDMLHRLRDMIPFLKGRDLDRNILFLKKLCYCQEINSHQRLSTAICLYNHMYIDICYDCFEGIALDESVEIQCKVESIKYLFSTKIPKYIDLSLKLLKEIINCPSYEIKYRYEIIASFISKTGISSIQNFTKINVIYDEYFVYKLQISFFENKENEITYRLLSAQHIMQMKGVSDEEKLNIEKFLFEVAEDEKYNENIRADAADIILRLGKNNEKALKIIKLLGCENNDNNKTLLEKARTIYDNSQNVHNFSEQAEKFIEDLLVNSNIKPKPYNEIHEKVGKMVRNILETPKQKFKAYKSLNRISIDTARFTKYKVTLSEIFVFIWLYCDTFEQEISENIRKRLIEELVDMGETCSSGHAIRFVNAFSSYCQTFKISYFDQIESNIKGRLDARIRDCKDEKIKDHLVIAITDLADDEDKKVYQQFLEENLKEIKTEMKKEFVEEEYISNIEFEEIYNSIISKNYNNK